MKNKKKEKAENNVAQEEMIKEEQEKNTNKEIKENSDTEKITEQKEAEEEQSLIITEIEKKVEQDKKIKKHLPKHKLEKINTRIFQNLLIAIFILIYFFFLNLGYINIKQEAFIIDLKVFAVCTLALGIILFERAYKKDDGIKAIFGIETLVIALFTLYMPYMYLLGINFKGVVLIASLFISIYYVLKSIIIYIKAEKEYQKSFNDMKEIIKN